MQLHKMLRQWQTEPHAVMFAANIGVELAEAFERLWDIVDCHANARIGHGERQPVIQPERRHPHLAALQAEPDAVGHQIGENLADALRVAAKLRQARLYRNRQANTGLFGLRRHETQGGFDAFADIEKFVVESELSGVEFGNVEDVIDKMQEMHAAIDDAVDPIAILARSRSEASLF